MFLLIDAELPRSLALAAQLHARGFVAHARGPIAQTAVASLEEELDVALLQLGGTDWDAIAHAQRLFARDASIEVIFFAESECAQLAMARGLGIQGILPAEAVAEWTLAAAPSLVGSVRARRALTESTRGIPPLPPFPARPRWAGPTSESVSSALREPAAHGMTLDSVECHATRCRLAVQFDDESSDKRVLPEFFSLLVAKGIDVQGMRFVVPIREPAPDGKIHATIHVFWGDG
jgi:hypothetical protein